MITFAISAALLASAALVLLLLPLPADAALASDVRRTRLSIALAIPLAAASIYLALGNRVALEGGAAAAPAAAADPQVEEMVKKLAARLERDPSDRKGWAMLARSYKVMGRLREAEAAYERAGDALDAGELANYADVAVSNAGGKFAGKPALILERALRADPKHPMALWLAGAAALETGNAGGAVRIWEKLLAVLPPESDDAREVRAQIAQASAARR